MHDDRRVLHCLMRRLEATESVIASHLLPTSFFMLRFTYPLHPLLCYYLLNTPSFSHVIIYVTSPLLLIKILTIKCFSHCYYNTDLKSNLSTHFTFHLSLCTRNFQASLVLDRKFVKIFSRFSLIFQSWY